MTHSFGTRRVVVAAMVIAAAGFLAAEWGSLTAAVGAIARLGPITLTAGLLLVAAGVLVRGVQARFAHHLAGVPARFAPMVQASACSYATNKVVKSGGAAGLLPFFAEGRRIGATRGKVSAAYVTMKFAESAALCALILIAVLASATSGALAGPMLVGALASLTYAVIVSTGLVLLGSSRSVTGWAQELGARAAGRLRVWFRRPPSGEAADGGALVETLARIRSAPASALPLLVSAVAGKAVGAACLLIVCAGFGVHLSVTLTLLVYTLTLMATMVGPLPGGIGMAEASLGAMLIAQGTAAPLAAAVVVAFRLLDLWLPLLIGAAAGLRHWEPAKSLAAAVRSRVDGLAEATLDAVHAAFGSGVVGNPWMLTGPR